MSTPETISEARCFDGRQLVLRHASSELDCEMECAVYLPPQAASGPVPVLWWLSGLTCTWENFTVKAGAQRYAAEHGVALVAPDTSPRGTALPGEDDDWDFGSGAGFYVNATEAPWSAHYRMYAYVTEELPALVSANFPVDPDRQSIFGHSMGGHGALVVALRNPQRYRSVSAFAPICAPSECPWGEKALGNYLGPERAAWLRYDACALLAESEWRAPILVDQGDADTFLEEQLRPDRLREACERAGVPLELHYREGYDHSYYFIASFVGTHIAHHARALSGER
ncbi:MAG: S-formylglutathione hydrolase [Myxococcota bacterium]